ncbi:hypothetical protein BDK51DRAFT_49552, partial [Blyttiomyces helicus]
MKDLRHAYDVAEVQDPFQPGSAPQKGNKRYLGMISSCEEALIARAAFNMTGIIYSTEISSPDPTSFRTTTLAVEFHDRSQRPIHFSDRLDYTVACLGEAGALFATEGSGSATSRIAYRPFDGWGGKAEWSLEMGVGENVKVVAITSKGPVAATDARYLRFFTYSGIQTAVVSLPGPVVTLAARGRWLLVVYHVAGVYHGDQSMAYILYDAEEQRTVHRDALPLSPGATLDWAGVSENGLPATYDSSGVLRLLFPHSDFAWVPVFDGRNVTDRKKERHWAVDVMDTAFMAVLCKVRWGVYRRGGACLADVDSDIKCCGARDGESKSALTTSAAAFQGSDKHPNHPRPIISEVPFQVPLLELTAGSVPQEESLVRSVLFTMHLRAESDLRRITTSDAEIHRKEIDMDKVLLQMILAACKAERVQRALDLCVCLHLVKSIDGAMKIAVVHRLPALAERMNIIKEAHLAKQFKQEQSRFDSHTSRWASPGRPTAPPPVIDMAFDRPPSALRRTAVEKLKERKRKGKGRVRERPDAMDFEGEDNSALDVTEEAREGDEEGGVGDVDGDGDGY